ncbi:glycosyltransferase family 2 protein [Candidatus Woesearchaeota archaeon]|nr:glycosyltransferase family 2 protein [Candidatus Woesearchaeota archaeon]
MNIVIPAAGLGSRFTKAGIDTPKPLIEIRGKPMVKWAVESLPFSKNSDLIFIIRKEHVDRFQLDAKLKEIFSPEIRVIVIDYVTEGAACTVLLAKEFINNDEPLIVSDCDHFFRNDEYNNLVASIPEGVAGAIPVFKAEGEKWSFTKFDGSHTVSQVAEKVRISDYANIGGYFFSRGSDFVSAAEEMIAKGMKIKNEYYVAPVYERLLVRGKTIKAAICNEVWGLGTPEDVKNFEENFKAAKV